MAFCHVMWDFDGTLFDTYPAMEQAMQQALREKSVQVELSEIDAQMKQSVSHAIAWVQQRYTLNTGWLQRFEQLRRQLESMARPFPFAQEICAAVAVQGGANYLVTHRGSSAVTHLQRAGMARYFTECVTSENRFERKPSPQAVTYLLRKYRIDPAQALMVGDRELDILAGKNAGIAACFFENREKLRTAGGYADSVPSGAFSDSAFDRRLGAMTPV